MSLTFIYQQSLKAIAFGLVFSSFAFAGASAHAESNNSQKIISIPVNTVIRGIGEGNTQELASENIDSETQGMDCRVVTFAENQGSVHPGNDLIVASGDNTVVLADVERAAGVTTEANQQLRLSDTVTVSLRMGEDDVFSAGMDVYLKCQDVPEIEVCRDGEIITIKEDERLETDTDTCPTPEEIQVCRDGEIITITEDQKQEGDTAACKGIQVCRDGEVITITENDRRDTDVEGDTCPQTLGTQTELPKTGAAATSTLALTISTLGTGAYGFIQNRRK